MKKIITLAWFIANCAAATAWAQAYPFNEAGVTMGHWHLNSKDVEASKKLFVAMGGTAIKPGDFELVRFPGVIVNLHLRQPAPPANGGTVGSVVNHVGFIVNNVQVNPASVKLPIGRALKGKELKNFFDANERFELVTTGCAAVLVDGHERASRRRLGIIASSSTRVNPFPREDKET